jgi:hypothetical protein
MIRWSDVGKISLNAFKGDEEVVCLAHDLQQLVLELLVADAVGKSAQYMDGLAS